MRKSPLDQGDQVKIIANPLKNGNAGGMARTITNVEGAKLGRQEG